MSLDRMDAETARERLDYLVWRQREYPVEERENGYKELDSLEGEIEMFLFRCAEFGRMHADDDGTFARASRIYRTFLHAPCRMAYAESFDPSIRKGGQND